MGWICPNRGCAHQLKNQKDEDRHLMYHCHKGNTKNTITKLRNTRNATEEQYCKTVCRKQTGQRIKTFYYTIQKKQWIYQKCEKNITQENRETHYNIP